MNQEEKYKNEARRACRNLCLAHQICKFVTFSLPLPSSLHMLRFDCLVLSFPASSGYIESLRVRHISAMCLSVPSLSTERKETGNTSSFLHSSILLLKTGPRNFFAKQASKSVLHNMRNDKGLLASSLPIVLFS